MILELFLASRMPAIFGIYPERSSSCWTRFTVSSESFSVFRVRTYIYSNLSDPDLNRSSIAEYLHMSQDYLSYVFHQKFNQTLSAYITSMRIDKAKELLERTNCGMDINCRKNWIFQQLLLS